MSIVGVLLYIPYCQLLILLFQNIFQPVEIKTNVKQHGELCFFRKVTDQMDPDSIDRWSPMTKLF